MRKILFLSLLATLLVAQNPRAYSAIGNTIYDNAPSILNLKHLEQYKEFEVKIDNYYFDVDEIKDRGFELDANKKTITSKEYLGRLRGLLKINNFFVKMAKGSFKSSMANEDSQLFSDIINSGLIDTQKNKKKILTYYFKHIDEIEPDGTIETFLNEDKKLRLKREAWLKSLPTKEQIQRAKIQRIRDKDRAKKDAHEKELQEILERTKVDIRENQKKELSH